MGEKRKLQGEIERCLKKVTEGVELFDEIFEKFHAAPQQNQKEKFEADLKKEIKKLQRLRDQIKGWLSSNDIKDKQLLQDNRKLIETQMERFKAVERETKTKAFSKSGLTAEQKLDPKEREREEMRTWLQDSIDRINQQNDQFESEIESLEALAGKKKKLEKEKQDKVDECRRHLERHKFHVQRLELLLRLLDNTTVDPAQIRDIKDDVEYYIENCMDPDFEENEYIYDEFNLDLNELNQQLGNIVASAGDELEAGNSETGTTASTTSTAPSPGPLSTTRESSGSKEPEDKSRHASGEETVRVVKPTVNRAHSISRSTPTTPFKQSSVDTPNVSQAPPVTTPPLIPNVPYNSVAAGIKNVVRPSVATATAANSTPYKTTESISDSIVQASVQSPAKAAAVLQRAESTPPTMPEQQQSSLASLRQFETIPQRESAPATPVQQPPISAPTPLTAPTTESLPVLQQENQNQSYQLPQLEQNLASQAQLQSLAGFAQLPDRQQPASVLSWSAPPQPQPHVVQQAQQSQLASVFSQSAAQNMLQQQQQVQMPSALQQQQTPVSQFGAAPANGGPAVLTAMQQRSQTMPTAAPGPNPLMNGPLDAQKENVDSLRLMAQQVISAGNVPLGQNISSGNTGLPSLRPQVNSPFANFSQPLMMQLMPQQGREQEAKVTPFHGASPLGKLPLSHVMDGPIFQILEAASTHLPQPADSERFKVYLPRTPAPTPPYYPQHDSLVGFYDTLEYYQRLQPETLFFAFYYMEGTKAQYLAASALKKQSWRFHTKYKMWFQRHEEPKTITDEYEMGTYIYFDFERWAQRRKEGFTFEYRYLEDKEL